jgi:uncharacterized protein YndB with AHSA1/START domain
MPDILIWMLIALGVLAGVLALLALAGCFLPSTHIVARTLPTKQTPEVLWQALTDYAAVPSWHPEVQRVERLPDRNGREVWRETYKGNYPLQLETVEAEAPRRLVRAIADEQGPFQGRWEFEISPQETGSRLRITEVGVIRNPFFRLMAWLFMNPAVYLEMYLRALAAKFGEPAELEGAEPKGRAAARK